MTDAAQHAVDWTQMLVTAIPILVVQALSWAHTSRNRTRAEQERNQKMNVLLKEYPLHGHTEQEGPLSKEGVVFPRTLMNGNS